MLTADERIKSLSANEKRYLKRRHCMWCDGLLSSAGCMAIFEKCSERNRLDRLERCLAEYKPRKRSLTPPVPTSGPDGQQGR